VVSGRLLVKEERKRRTSCWQLTTSNRQLLLSQIFVAAAFVFQTMEFDVGGYERTVT
jgi:hypothetical protein